MEPDLSALETVVVPRTRDLGDNFEVRRALPTTRKRMVGPFVFLDQMGPHGFEAGHGLDVRPHPHIGLATVTYLLDGEIEHRDSVGSVQIIRPGAVNWMTAGSGIVHSERTNLQTRQHPSSLFGLQCWVALPKKYEEVAPSFAHIAADALPVIQGDGASAVIVAGDFFGKKAPVPTLSDLFYVDVRLEPGARLDMPADYPEQAVYVVEGALDLGRDGIFEAGQLLVLKPDTAVTLRGGGFAPTRLMLLGGEPMDGARYLMWNFVSSSPDRLEQAKEDWREQRFARVPGESEFIPMPDLPGKPVGYP
ncbi:MAG: pirin family protein [Oxalicibacterium faecigallinarum]|uniref:pirin family protein n=1 Tax=Oxalicibacterium faecigallinarum TaxID=573741 RepID=UPI0028085353|nr:pirin family protein [Oxalicibacterium faecigallinarum]MDQ7968894.1 pirin family protein [Oxalicibacterium faecigallinarum]